MSFAKNFKGLSGIKPMLNIGCLHDIPTGTYVLGKNGESILIGGVPHIEGVIGRGNTNKSTLTKFRITRILDRYGAPDINMEPFPNYATAMEYDTENSSSIKRIESLSKLSSPRLVENLGIDQTGNTITYFKNPNHYLFTDNTEQNGTEWFSTWKGTLNAWADDKKLLIDTPIVDPLTGETMKIKPISLTAVDSLSRFRSASVDKIIDNADVGESGRNVEALRDAMAKSQLLNELPALTARAGAYIVMTGHVGDNMQMDPMAPPMKKLAFLKQSLKIKHVPEPFTFLTNALWMVNSTSPLINQSTKAPEFPRNSDDDLRGDTDLLEMSAMLLRCKSGPSGIPIDFVISQSEGLHPGLSEFLYIRKYDRFGLEGNVQNYQLSLVPDVNMSRTTIRKKIAENKNVERALEITSELCQMTNLWHHLPDGLLCSPKQLYEDLKARGYDWNVLLATRGYWVPDQYNHPVPYLSTMDLLNMRAGTYVPFWMSKEDAAKLK